MRDTNITETLGISEPQDRASPDPNGGSTERLIESAIQLLAAVDSALPIASCRHCEVLFIPDSRVPAFHDPHAGRLGFDGASCKAHPFYLLFRFSCFSTVLVISYYFLRSCT